MGKIDSSYSLGDLAWNQQPVDMKKTGDVKKPRPDVRKTEINENPPQDPVDPSTYSLEQSVSEAGAVNTFVQSKPKIELKEIEDGRIFDITTAEGSLEMLTESVEAAIGQFVEYGLQETLGRVQTNLGGSEKLSERYGTDASLLELADKIRDLRKKEARFVYQAIEKARGVLKAIRGEGEPAAAAGKLSLKSSERAAKCEEACDALRRAVRNFRYNFDQVCHAKDERHGDVSLSRKLRQFFSASHTKVFALISRQGLQHFGTDTIEALDEAEREFMQAANKFMDEKLHSGDISLGDFSVTSLKAAEKISDTLHLINEANRQLNGENLEIYQLQSAKAALEDIARHGGSQTLEFSGGAGWGAALPKDLLSTAAMAKLKHTVRIFGRGDGSVTVEVLTEGDLGVKAKVGFDDVAKIKFDAHGGKTLSAFDNRAETFTDVDSAAQYLASGSSDWAAKLSSTVGGRGKSGAAKMLWAKIKSWFKTGNVFDEREYVNSMKDRNVLKSCDSVLRRRLNSVTSARKTISRWSGGVGGGVDFNLGNDILNVGVEGRVEGRSDTGMETRYRTYLADLEETHAGRLVEFYRSRHLENGDYESTSFVPPKDVLAFLDRSADKDEDKVEMCQTAIRLLQLLKNNIESCEDSVNDLVKAGRSLTSDQFAALAERYKDAAQALAAIAEKWNADLGDEVGAKTSKVFATLCDSLRVRVQNPGVAFTRDDFRKLLEVEVAEVRADETEKHVTVSLNLDFLKKLDKLALGLEGPLADIGLNFVTESLRALTGAAVNGGLGALGLKGKLTYENVVTRPNTGDRRPWANAKRETMNLRLPNNLIFGAVAAMVLNHYLAKFNLSMPVNSDQVMTFLKSGGAAALKRIFFDLFAHVTGGSGAKSISNSKLNSLKEFTDQIDYKPFVETYKDTTGTNFQLNWEDDRLVSVAIGKHELFALNLGLGHVGPIFEFGVKFDRVTNTDIRLVENASFNSIASLCDRHVQNDNVTDLLMFAKKNVKTFVRMHDVIAGRERGPDEAEGAQFQQDRAQFSEMMEDIEKTVESENGEADSPLARNYKNLQRKLTEIKTADETVGDDMKMRQVADFFRYVSRHYTLAERNVKEEPVADRGRSDGDELLLNSRMLA